MSDLRSPAVSDVLEREIRGQIASIEAKIRELNEEKAILERMLLKARAQSEMIRRTDVTRKNSISRVLVENSVLESLKGATRPRRTSALYDDAKLVVGKLQKNTFRSMLHRMKGRALIEPAGFGKWTLGAKHTELIK